MNNTDILSVYSIWVDEFNYIIKNNDIFYIAFFTSDRKLIYASSLMNSLLANDPFDSFLNPTFENILSFDNTNTLIFEGFMTFGDWSSVNTSIWGQIYRKENNFFLIGGVNATQLIEQNKIMHQLNNEINNLQRQLIKEKHNLENTLEQVKKLNEELEELNTTKDKFISILAHDLKNPFTLLLGHAELLLKNIDKYDKKRIQQSVEVISNTTKKTYELLEQILLWAKSQSGKIAFDYKTFNFIDILYELTDTFDNQIQEKKLIISIPESIEIKITSDKNLLKTVVRNLLANAIKFSHIGGQISFKAAINNEFLHFSIIDNGIGIEKSIIPLIWNVKENYTTIGTQNEKGSGFGLKLCKEIIEKLGGNIWAESEQGKGSNFQFTIPINLN